LKISEPPDACQRLVEETSPLVGNNVSAVLATEWGCDLHTKLVNAKEAGFKCIIIMSNSEEARAMAVQLKDMLRIHVYKMKVLFIGYQDGQALKEFALGESSISP